MKVDRLTAAKQRVLPVGVYYTCDDSHWCQQVLQKTENHPVFVAWCGDFNGDTAAWVAQMLNKAAGIL